MNQIEFLLRLSENAQDEGEEIAKRHNLEREAFIKQLLDLEKMIDLARQNVHAELGRWGIQGLPKHPAPQQGQLPPNKMRNEPLPQESMPRVVQKGPAA